MKPALLLSSLIFFAVHNASSQQTPAMQVADRIAQKMKDTLNLSAWQKGQLYDINMNLSNSQTLIWQRYSNHDSISFHIQRIEKTRDSLYRPVLMEEKYLLYKVKKANLVNNN